MPLLLYVTGGIISPTRSASNCTMPALCGWMASALLDVPAALLKGDSRGRMDGLAVNKQASTISKCQ